MKMRIYLLMPTLIILAFLCGSVCAQQETIVDTYGEGTVNSLAAVLDKEILAVIPNSTPIARGDEKAFAIGYTNTEEGAAEFRVRAYPLYEGTGINTAYSPYPKTLKKGDKHITPVYVRVSENASAGKHVIAAELYKEKEIVAEERFEIVVEGSFIENILLWLRSIFS